LIANAPLNDKTYANQKKATQILEPLLLQHPDHPGLAHYIIHADDNPVLARQALDAAHRYSQIAPDSPHALHMPSHIFTRLGLWGYWIERRQWSAAAALPLPLRTIPGDAYASTEATLYFARALGAARSRDVKAAQAALQQQLSLRDVLAQRSYNDADQVNIQMKIVSAWIGWEEGGHTAALQEMRTAIAMEDAHEKSPVSPGSIAPALEMLGDMLLLAKQLKLALAAYESALQSNPGRLRAEYGAAVSAQEAGLRSAAEEQYRRLLTNCSHADSDLPELRTQTWNIGLQRHSSRRSRGLKTSRAV
jgi:tetratricopeptide (TPR) repeat protein